MKDILNFQPFERIFLMNKKNQEAPKIIIALKSLTN